MRARGTTQKLTDITDMPNGVATTRTDHLAASVAVTAAALPARGRPGRGTGLVDGFAAAAALRGNDPASFGTMAGTPAPFGYAGKAVKLRAC
jgi:hypothetical protein